MKRDKILENDNRNQINSLVHEKPGLSLTSIIKELEMAYTTATYHTTFLEQRKYIKSEKDGKYLRFYPRIFNIPTKFSKKENIIKTITENDFSCQKEIANIVGYNESAVSKIIKELAEQGIINITKIGKYNRCSIINQ
jgi:predicted transcriptional regulator